MHLLLLRRTFFTRCISKRHIYKTQWGQPWANPEGRWILELSTSFLPANKIPRVLVDRRAGVAAPTKCSVALAALRLSVESVFPSCVNRFYAKCNRESREGNCAPHCLFWKLLAPDDTLRFYPISRHRLYFSARRRCIFDFCQKYT